MSKKKLLIKVSSTNRPPWIPYIAGIGRSTLCLLNELHKIEDKPFDIEVYVDGLASLFFDFYNWRWKHHRFLIPTMQFAKLHLPIQANWRRSFLNYDLLHIPHNWDTVYKGEKFVVSIHDTIDYEMCVESKSEWRIEQYRDMLHNSLAIMTCSQYSKHNIVNTFHIPEEKVHVVYWGISREIFHKNDLAETSEQLDKLGISETGYFVAVSCAHPRKNTRTLLKAYRRFLNEGGKRKLVVVWGNPPKELITEYAAEIASHQLLFLNHVTDDTLRALYNGASCTMFPSRAEGFGFPILESFACGTPVMTCRNTCLEEVGQDAAIYVGEDDIDAMTDVMNMFETDSYDLTTFRSRAERIVNTFTWENTARQYIDFYMKYL